MTKKPQEGRYVALQQQIGSNSQYRTSIDATGAIDEARTLLYRVNGSYASNESFRDFVGNERVFIAPSLSWRPNQRFELNIDLEHKRDRFHPDIGIPAIGNRPAQVPLNRNLSDSPTREPITNTLVAFDWTYRLDENWAIKQRFLQQDWTLNAKQVLMGALQANDRTLARNLLLSTQDVDTRSTNLDLTGKVNFLGARHSLLFGIDGFAAQTRAHQFFGAGPTIDIFNPVYGQVNWDSVSRNNNFYRKESWTGLYAQDQITVADKLHVLLGGRYDRVKTGAISSPISMDAAKAARIERVDTEFSPRVGLLYQLTPGMSLYGSYTQSFGANNGVSVDGRAFSPQKGKQYEIGFKTESADKRLSSTVAIFDLTKYNMLTTDPNNAGFQILAGTAKSSGIEIDVSGQVSRQFSVLATYAYTDARYTVNNNGLRGNRLENAPAHQGSLWGVYQHSDAIRVGLGGVAVGLRQADANNTVQLPGFARLDAMASYLMRSGRSKLTAQLNAYNLTDKAYFANSSGGRNTSMPGAPRTFMVSLKYEY
ncbi:MAG: TonB-dependent siderophore receptor [Burkholderiaceae bacterium]|nr:TonB-dependent siderophore receptor [Burkholderiaceae bacterium]